MIIEKYVPCGATRAIFAHDSFYFLFRFLCVDAIFYSIVILLDVREKRSKQIKQPEGYIAGDKVYGVLTFRTVTGSEVYFEELTNMTRRCL